MRWILALAAGCTACARSTPPTSPAGPTPAERQQAETNVVWLESTSKEMCACTELSCLERVTNALSAWMPEHFGEARFDQPLRQRMLALVEANRQCSAAVTARVQADINCPGDLVIAEIRALDVEMCACTSAACASRVNEKLAALTKRHADLKATDAQIQEAGAVMVHMGECATRAAESRP